MSKPTVAELVNIRPGVTVLSVLRHLKYTPWFVLAEFVDNSIQSYLNHRAQLEKLGTTELKVEIRISNHPRPGTRLIPCCCRR
jgi:hypothetical protein